MAQSKFHANPVHACASNDLSELPMAMVKLNYSDGLFVTNARISPQGKREFLDNYPKLNLEFLDGDSLAEEVMSNTMLKALWFDGAIISRVNVSTVFPLLARRHEEDLPIKLDETNIPEAIERLRKRYPHHDFRLESATSTTQPFKNCRAPEPLTVEEGIMGVLHITELVVEGELDLAEVAKSPHAICKALFNAAVGREPSKARHMVATIGNDPFEETDRTTYLTCELAEHLDQVPSPIRPEVRRFRMTMAWRSDLTIELLSEIAKTAAKETQLHHKSDITIEHLDGKHDPSAVAFR